VRPPAARHLRPKGQLEGGTRAGFEAMNRALKQRAEQLG
jgi:hypothetical protein